MNITTSFFQEISFIYQDVVDNIFLELLLSVRDFFGYKPWVCSVLGALIIGVSSMLPVFFIRTKETLNERVAESKFIKALLSFAVGELLGDVFIHLLPEAWEADKSSTPTDLGTGVWVLSTIIMFAAVEKMCKMANRLLRKTGDEVFEEHSSEDCVSGDNDELKQKEKEHHKLQQDQLKIISGLLHSMANSAYNFMHGLTVAGSFFVNFRLGILATFAILLHQVPHEVGDFVILLRCGFTRRDATRAQLLTAGAGLVGALVAIGCAGVTSAMEARSSCIVPFTAGGFLYIALVKVLPDLMKEEEIKESLMQLIVLIFGIISVIAW